MLKSLVLLCLMMILLSFSLMAQPNEGEKVFQLAMQEYYKEKYAEAYKLMLQASAKNHAEAYTILGRMQAAGEGTKVDHNASVKSLQKAVALKDQKAYMLLGHAYNNGEGAPKDESLAQTTWAKSIPEITKAADQGNVFWCMRLAYAYKYGYGISENQTAAFAYMKKAADAGYATAQYQLGIEFLGLKDYPESTLWLRKASANGNHKAKFEIGYGYYFGRGVKENNELAFQWFKEAAQAGNVEANAYLGTMYDNGLYVDRDWNETFKYYSIYEKLGGDTKSFLTALGEFYVFGINGAPKDLEKANELFIRTGANSYLEILDKIGKESSIRGSNAAGDIVEITNSNKEPQILASGDIYWREKIQITFKASTKATVWPTSSALAEYELKRPNDEIKYSQYSPSPEYSSQNNSGTVYIVRKEPARQIRYMYVVCGFNNQQPVTIKIPLAVCWPAE